MERFSFYFISHTVPMTKVPLTRAEEESIIGAVKRAHSDDVLSFIREVIVPKFTQRLQTAPAATTSAEQGRAQPRH